jgi:hypothetical protein
VPRIAAALGKGFAPSPAEAAAALQARESLAEAGVATAPGAQICITEEATAAYAATPWQHDRPAASLTMPRAVPADGAKDVPSLAREAAFHKYLSRILAGAEGVQAARVWQAAGTEQRCIMVSAGGPGTGHTGGAQRKSPFDLLPNAHWRAATALRLGLVPQVPGTICKLKKDNGHECGFALAGDPHHATKCRFGAARSRVHRHLETTLARVATPAGGFADAERYVPELYDTIVRAGAPAARAAIMDVVVTIPGSLRPWWIDVSVRCPLATRYDPEGKPGDAARTGEREKHTRYGACVKPLVFESFGRLGQEGHLCIKEMVAALAAVGGCSPHAAKRWRLALERALLFAEADNLLRCLGAELSSLCRRFDATAASGRHARTANAHRQVDAAPAPAAVETGIPGLRALHDPGGVG